MRQVEGERRWYLLRSFFPPFAVSYALRPNAQRAALPVRRRHCALLRLARSSPIVALVAHACALAGAVDEVAAHRAAGSVIGEQKGCLCNRVANSAFIHLAGPEHIHSHSFQAASRSFADL